MGVQITGVHGAFDEPFDPPPGHAHSPRGEAPAPGSTTVRWNSCPRIGVPAAASTLSVTATASRYPSVSRSDIRAEASSTPHIGIPSNSRHRYSNPAHSAATGLPLAASSPICLRRASLADNSEAYTSGNPPPMTTPEVPSGSSSSRSGSKVTTSAPAAVNSSACSA